MYVMSITLQSLLDLIVLKFGRWYLLLRLAILTNEVYSFSFQNSGVILSSVSYPQASVARPILADLSGDGTSDIIVISTDAVWGYKVSIRASSASFLRIVSGLLFMATALAALYNRFSQPPGIDRRSTDA